LVEHRHRVIAEGQKERVVEALQILDPGAEDIDIIEVRESFVVRVTHKSRGIVDLSSFGDGTRRAAALVISLTRAFQGVLLIDEIEASMHPLGLQPVLGNWVEAASKAHVQTGPPANAGEIDHSIWRFGGGCRGGGASSTRICSMRPRLVRKARALMLSQCMWSRAITSGSRQL